MAGSLDYYVTMLGEFSIQFRTKRVYDQSNRSKKPWNLLEYLIAHRDRTIPQNELVDLLWNDDESDNPTGALKVLLHRVRKSLEPVCSDMCEELIILKKGCYSWNKNNKTVVDVDLFENYCKKASAPNLSDDEKLELYEKAFELYKGDFLPRNTDPWVMHIASYYHDIYLKAVRDAVRIYYDKSCYQEIVALCRKAITVEKYDESLYYDLVNSLYKSGQQTEALNEYSQSTDLFYKKFGITPSDDMKSLYKTIMKTTQTLETDISIIKEALMEKGRATGAFYCEYEFFKDTYQLEARACARSGDSIYLCLITLSGTSDDEVSVKTMNKAMGDLAESINDTLRKGDVYARYSVSQYVLLLPTTTYENVEMIVKRLSSAFYRKYMKKDIGLQYKLQPLEPKM